MTDGKSVFYELAKFVGACAVVFSACATGWTYVGKPWAQNLIESTVADELAQRDTKIDGLSNQIQTLIDATEAEARQSAQEARINRQLLCLAEVAADSSRGTAEDCLRQ